MGEALLAYCRSGQNELVQVHTSYGPDEEYESKYFFRDENELPEIEEYALLQCNNRILEIGSGAGSHALILQNDGQDITAMDVSAGCVNVMLKRGVQKIIHGDVFQDNLASYDTVIMLMNGIGIAGSQTGLVLLLEKLEKVTTPGAQIVFDSTDIRYIMEDKKINREEGGYMGQVRYQFEYKDKKGAWFDWLFIDPDTLIKYCRHTNWMPQVIFDDIDGHYLARLQKKQ